ncbi:MAG TPA: coproporphyrinogen III oxidase, partial [Actinomycetes bacterium]|nr:coproporphyrinogen III oxidase [Actinomycetes bacterium]
MTAVLPNPTAAPLVDPGLFGVYVHVPFCRTRCHYCDFVTYTGMEGLRRPYAAALGEEGAMAAAALGPEP